MPNKLIHEKSLYLRQHADNPINWVTLRDNPFEMAKELDKPVFLSIGYSACYWCHVMSRKTFSNEEVADFLNEHFISVKVDKEEYPDIDKKYQFFLQISKQSGGWPLSIFTDSDKIPFYGGTYFPPKREDGLEGFLEVIKGIYSFYKNNPEKLFQIKKSYQKSLDTFYKIQDRGITYKDGIDGFEASYPILLDLKNGGLKGEAKFPNIPMLLGILEDKSGNMPKHFDFLIKTADTLCTSGIYDHINGGFFRYCVNSDWSVPHFEKMLYDNALNVLFLSKMFKLTENRRYLFIAEDTLNFLFHEFFTENGFISSMNAESKDEAGNLTEGYYYLIDENCFAGMTDKEKSILSENLFFVEKVTNLKKDISFADLVKVFSILKKIEIKREKPTKDNKIILSYNALLVVAMIEFFEASADDFYLTTALNLLNKILANFTINDKYVRIRYEDAYLEHVCLEDFAYILYALTKAHNITKDKSFISIAKKLITDAFKIFYYNGKLYFDKEKSLIDTFDEAIFSAFGLFLSSVFYFKNFTTIKEDIDKILLFAKHRLTNYPQAHPTLYTFFKTFYT